MKRFLIRSFLLCSVLMILTGLTLVETKIRTSTFLGMTIMDRDQYLDYISDKTYVYDPTIDLYFDDTSIPYIESFGSYLFPIGSTSEGLVRTDTNHQLILVFDDADQFTTNFSDNIAFELCLVNGENYDVKTITFTNLPLIIIEGYEKIDNDNYGSFTLIDPDNERHLYEITQSDVKYHRRGNYTATAPKPSFKLTLLDDQWESEAHDLLGLRDDDDWILQSMVTDTSKIKEKLAITMWNGISDRYQLGYEYVEVIIDGAYMGIYGLQTPLDHKTFEGSKKNDLLIKIDDWKGDSDYGNISNWVVDEESDQCQFNEYEVKPCNGDIIEDVVETIDTLHTDLDSFADAFDLTNCANYQLLLNLSSGVDNTYKNQRLCLSEHGLTISILKGAWDFDFCFQYSDDGVDQGIYTDGIVPDAIRNGPSYFRNQCDQYRSLREGMLSDTSLVETISSWDDQLRQGGALIRDESTWDYTGWAMGRVDHNAALDLIIQGLTSRFVFLDDYYQVN